MLKFVVVVLISSSTSLFSQSLNDYRSTTDGDWDDPLTWQVYNGSSWVGATNYPGEVSGTNNVSIEGGNSVDLNTTIPNSINSLTVGDGIGGTDTLEVSNTSSLNTLLITIEDGGYATWTSNVTLFLPEGAAVIIIPSGSLDTSRPCSAAKRIQIGTIIYSTCNGGAGADYSFDDLNNAGGSLSVTPSSNSPICPSETLTLMANPSGTGSGSATISWTGTGPGSYSFSSSLENPTETGLSSGTYTYTATISDGSISNTNSIDVIVDTQPSTPISGGNQTVCRNASTFPTLTVTINAGETVDWYTNNIGGTLLLSSSTNYTPSSAGDYYAETRNTTTGCISATRTKITLSLKSCNVITNRRITYRVGATLDVPIGTLTNDLIINYFDDGQNGSGNSYQLQAQNNTAIGFNYQIWVQNVPYSSIPGLNLGNHTLKIKDNGDGTYNYLFTSITALGAYQNTIINGSGGAPSPLGIGIDCGCITFYKI
ncbi:immunoglobulin domain-containing protein [Aquimarina pacifica]|uniref:immunoglobulin domain-containing protein n=1 Tax=Aquimarina pacifica TaxID=1296415 RepID=UPI00047101DC|nr:hypothetical protein [Aquimarina pacifica]